ncbi:MAG: cation-translocating P-type ATPase [Eubacteriales bacterium]|nr:cation-translocating P-type ATPase [Eubacteriales bacterium]
MPIPGLFKKKKKRETETLVRVKADGDTGLTREQVLARIRGGYVNTAVDPPSKSVRQIVFGNLFTYFNLIFFVLAIFVIAVGAYNDLLFLPVVIANILIGTVQEIKAKRTLDSLTLLTAARVQVVREGRVIETTPENLVVDDVVIFGPGSQICADATVLSGEVTLSEALVTGESDEIIKKEGGELISGSYVISGSCRARLERVGADSFVSKLAIDAKKTKKKFGPGMMRSLTLLIKIIGLVILPVGIIMFYKQTNILGMSVRDSVVRTTAALIGMIPEGLYLLVSVALAVSVIRLAQKKTLVHEMGSIETLARVDVLCVDKTGTITENEMRVDDIIPLNPEMYDKKALTAIMKDITGNLEADNNTMLALKSYFSGNGYRRAQRVVPFSSTNKRSAVSFGPNENYVIGAPESILERQYRHYREMTDDYAAQGYRVLLLASADGPIPMALVLLSNPIRPQAKATFAFFERQGVAVKVISGDNPITVSCAARMAGIPMAESYIDASQLDTPEKLQEAATEYTVFGRVTPEQKRQLVRAIRKSGHTAAMTGDGVNDVLALKEADCSIAMASGSDIACRVSQLVLLDSNFASMPLVVAEGRRVINNIERSASLFLVKNIYSFFLALISIAAVFGYPIEPSQLSLINLVTIGIPSFVLALEPNTNIVKGKFLRNVLYRALPAALTNLFLTVGVVLFSFAFELDSAQTSTITALLVGIVGLIMLFRVCRPFNRRRIILLVSMCMMFIVGIVFFGDLFSITPPDMGSLLILIVFALLAYPAMRCFSIWLDGAGGLFRTIKTKLKAKIKLIIARGKRRI